MKRAAAFLLIGLALAAPAARAQPAASKAEELFRRAQERMAAHAIDEACPLYAESYRLDPAGGTLQNLAVCSEELGKVATAYARFQELRAVSKKADPPRLDRVRVAEEHIAKLTPRLSRIRVLVAEANRGQGLRVEIDGVAYEEASWTSGIFADPGEHTIGVSAPGKFPFTAKTTINREGASENVAIPALADAAMPKPAAPARPTTSKAGLVIGSLGLATIGAGAVFGVLTITTNSAGKDLCTRDGNPKAAASDFDPATGRCYTNTAAWKDANHEKDKARTFANVANVLFPVGLVGLGIGTVLVVRSRSAVAKDGSGTTARLTASATGLSLEGELR